MAYEPTNWKNREVERPRTFTLQNNDDGTITLIPAEGKVTEPGTPIVAPLLNKIEGQLVYLDESFTNMYSVTDGAKTKTPASNDLNDLRETGFYSIPYPDVINGPQYQNNPSLYLDVIVSATETPKGRQITQSTFRSGAGSFYIRAFHWPTISGDVGSWSPWTEMAKADAVNAINAKFISQNIALGMNSSVGPQSNVSIGNSASSAGLNSLSLGAQSKAHADRSLALGPLSQAYSPDSIAIGYGAESMNNNAATLGKNTNQWRVPGAFSVTGTKQFEMPHPHPDKKATHVIRHASVESPTAGDTLYRYTIQAITDGETVILQLPDYFEYLNKDVDVYVSPHMHFGRAFGIVEGDTLKVTCEKAGSYKALVIGTRNDDHETVQSWNIKGAEREIGESWTGETYSYEVDEILEVQEITQGAI